jgi:hypothetical protein
MDEPCSIARDGNIPQHLTMLDTKHVFYRPGFVSRSPDLITYTSTRGGGGGGSSSNSIRARDTGGLDGDAAPGRRCRAGTRLDLSLLSEKKLLASDETGLTSNENQAQSPTNLGANRQGHLEPCMRLVSHETFHFGSTCTLRRKAESAADPVGLWAILHQVCSLWTHFPFLGGIQHEIGSLTVAGS